MLQKKRARPCNVPFVSPVHWPYDTNARNPTLGFVCFPSGFHETLIDDSLKCTSTSESFPLVSTSLTKMYDWHFANKNLLFDHRLFLSIEMEEELPREMANDSAHPAPTFGEDVFFEEWYKNRVHKKSRADKFGSSSRDDHHVIKSTARHLAMEIYLDEMSLQFGRHVQLMDDADGEVPARNGPREKKRRRLKGVMYTRLANGDIQQLSPLQSTWYNLYCRGEEIGTSLIPGFAEKCPTGVTWIS
jgi:hypothetical protein